MTKSMKKAIALCLFSMGVVGLMAQSNEFKIDVQKTGAPIQSTKVYKALWSTGTHPPK